MAFQTENNLPPCVVALKNVDALLRCPICFDFLSTSMMTKCSHNFCSLCIRKFFSYKLHCPVCNTQATEQDLRNNRLLDELVVNFQAARQQLSQSYFDSAPISRKYPASVKCKSPTDKGQKSNSSVVSHFFQKRPRKTPVKVVQTGRTGCADDADLCSTNVKEEPVDVKEGAQQEDTKLYDNNTKEEIAHSSSSPPTDVKPVMKVECPVCSVSVSQPFINKHLDMCLGSGEKKESLRNSLGKTKRPMAKLVYNLLSMQELKRRLKECHQSVKGSRDQLIKRHKEFVQIYNAQCDSLNPKSVEEIVKEVEATERIKEQLRDKAKPIMVISKKHSEEEIEEVHSTYRKQHSRDFSQLVAQVRGRLDTTRQTRIKEAAGGEDGEQSPSAAEAAKSRDSLDIKNEEKEEEMELFPRDIFLSNSSTYSDVSVSSSLSDICAPEPSINELNEEADERVSPMIAVSDWVTENPDTEADESRAARWP
ncbi:E3 ubiquitin-protein ligase RAD18 isoform X2 [Syngnathus typhle]|uniref:E3 ubiquitin-protein ligase RAD18 isoform X2 n=1 Tax=Syngnathus typhle TaxID=161592 RepID=UPI002A6A5EFD|nr:E3 ubiquitin-protein ligase RAD18 isoform X2 [Syngnathus typhle]